MGWWGVGCGVGWAVFPYLNEGHAGAVSHEGSKSRESFSRRSGSLGLCEEGRLLGEARAGPPAHTPDHPLRRRSCAGPAPWLLAA